jgi:hypothetical protein
LKIGPDAASRGEHRTTFLTDETPEAPSPFCTKATTVAGSTVGVTVGPVTKLVTETDVGRTGAKATGVALTRTPEIVTTDVPAGI